MTDKELVEKPNLEHVAVTLFAFMRQCGLNCIFTKDPSRLFTYHFMIGDMCTDGTPLAVGFDVDHKFLDDRMVKNNDESIEKMCYNTAVAVAMDLFMQKAKSVMQYGDSTEHSKIVIPK